MSLQFCSAVYSECILHRSIEYVRVVRPNILIEVILLKPIKLGKNERMTFAKIDEVLEMPNLIDMQKSSYEWFIKEGLREAFRDVSPITDYA